MSEQYEVFHYVIYKLQSTEIFFVICFTTLSISLTKKCSMVGLMVNGALERIWKKIENAYSGTIPAFP
jgi:hypothetical protein